MPRVADDFNSIGKRLAEITNKNWQTDFLVRLNGVFTYDWKPVSDRAIAWADRNCRPIRKDEDGFLLNMSRKHPNLAENEHWIDPYDMIKKYNFTDIVG